MGAYLDTVWHLRWVLAAVAALVWVAFHLDHTTEESR